MILPIELTNCPNETPEYVNRAHTQLTGSNFTFIGYHGTNKRASISILLNGFDIVLAGSSAGSARGPGLYVARYFNMAADFSDTATQASEPVPPKYETPRRPGLASQMIVMRVYARNFNSMLEGTDYEWGGMGNSFIPDEDEDEAITASHHKMAEIVFRARAFQQLVAFPTTIVIEEHILGDNPHSPSWLIATRRL